LLAATKRTGGKAESASPVALLMVVALSFLIFYPAGWTALQVGRHTFGKFSEPLAFGVGLAIQYLVDFLLVLMLAKLFQRFEVSRDSS
jgi:putative flippase GtrA